MCLAAPLDLCCEHTVLPDYNRSITLVVYRCRQPPSNWVWTSLVSSPARCLITRYKPSYIVYDVVAVCFELFHEIAHLYEMIENSCLDMYSLSHNQNLNIPLRGVNQIFYTSSWGFSFLANNARLSLLIFSVLFQDCSGICQVTRYQYQVRAHTYLSILKASDS